MGKKHDLTLELVVGAEQVDADEDAGTVTYRRFIDGTTWTDGVGVPMPVPRAIAE